MEDKKLREYPVLCQQSEATAKILADGLYATMVLSAGTAYWQAGRGG